MQLRDVYNSQVAWQQLMNSSIGGKMAYTVSKYYNNIERELKSIEKARQDGVKRYGSEDDKGQVSIQEDDTDALASFWTEFNELLDSDIDVDRCTVSMKELTEVLEEVKPSVLFTLEPFFKQE